MRLPLTGSWSSSRGKRYAYYHCPKTCPGGNVSKIDLEQRFLGLLDSLRPTPECLAFLHRAVLDVWKEVRRTTTVTRAELERRVADIRGKQTRLDDAYLYDRKIDDATYYDQRDRLREELAIAQLELSDAVSEDLDVEGSSPTPSMS